MSFFNEMITLGLRFVILLESSIQAGATTQVRVTAKTKSTSSLASLASRDSFILRFGLGSGVGVGVRHSGSGET